ncbi:hypothetical protein ACHAWF_010866 [Thalassiosira exigua]
MNKSCHEDTSEPIQFTSNPIQIGTEAARGLVLYYLGSRSTRHGHRVTDGSGSNFKPRDDDKPASRLGLGLGFG